MAIPLKTLIVEDSPDDAEIVLHELRRAGFDPDWIRVEREADFLAELQKLPDIILSDYSMPRFSGLKAMKLLRESGLNIPLILISGTVGEEVAVESIKYGAADYLIKDRIARLGTAVQRALDDRKLQQQRHEADEKLRRTDEALRQMVAHGPAVIYTLKIEGNRVIPVLVSENIERMLGFAAPECMTFDWWLAGMHPEDRDHVLAALATGMAGDGYSLEYRIRHKDGTYRWIEDSNRVIRDAAGQPQEIVGVWTNISERKRAEAAMRESEERFRQLAENTTAVLWIMSADFSTVLYISPSYEQVWGRTCQRLRENPASFTDAIHEADRRTMAEALTALMRGEKVDLEFRVVRPDETIRWVHCRGTPIRNDAGAVYRLAGIAEDISQRKETERQFRQAQKMEGIGQLAGGVAHDFNNILTIILVNLELVLMAEENLGAESKEYLAEIAQAAERAVALNRQLLTFSRKEAMQSQFVDLNDLAERFTKMLRRIVGEHIRVLTEFSPRRQVIKADPGMIEQVLMNLAVNARDAMPDGGQLVIGTAAVLTDERRAKLDLEHRYGHFACLSVSDTGTGIAPENMARIFEPFFTTKEVGKGTGLGLATVFGIAEQHKGWVDVASEVGVGTTFNVFFPFCAEGLSTSELNAIRKIRGGTERILLVEDEKGVRDVVLRTLEHFGYQVVEADSGIAAQKIWTDQGGQFDLLLTDMVMPGGLSGLKLIEVLRVQKPALKALLMSGYSAELAQSNLAHGRDITFLHKPFSTQVLAENIRRCLDAA